MTELRCPACGSAGGVTTLYRDIRMIGDVVRCDACKTAFPRQATTGPVASPLYGKSYYDAWSPDVLGEEGLAALKGATGERLLDAVSNYRTGGKLLDVGCAFGHLLRVAEQRGWDGYGVEISAHACGESQKIVPAGRVWNGDFLTAPLPAAPFDVITMVDLIEHIRDVRAVLGRCAALLKDSGLLAIVTPDADSMSRKVLGKSWPHFNKEHALYFSMSGIRGLMRSNGFLVREASPFPKALNMQYARSHLRAYGGSALKATAAALCRVLPDPLTRRIFCIAQGEMLVIAEKSEAARP